MLISVITRAYNRLEYTIQCISNAKQCMGLEFEHIIVNNNSNDGTKEWLASVKRNEFFKHLRVFNLDRNLGDMGGMIFGAEKAKGDYIIQMDNDCLLCQKNIAPIMIETIEALKCMAVMPLRAHLEDHERNLPYLSLPKKISVMSKEIQVLQVGFPVLFYLIRRDTFLKNSQTGELGRCFHHAKFGSTFKIMDIAAIEMDFEKDVNGKRLREHKYPEKIYHPIAIDSPENSQQLPPEVIASIEEY